MPMYDLKVIVEYNYEVEAENEAQAEEQGWHKETRLNGAADFFHRRVCKNHADRGASRRSSVLVSGIKLAGDALGVYRRTEELRGYVVQTLK